MPLTVNVCAVNVVAARRPRQANTIMFTTPLWTSVAAAVLLGQPWGRYDSLLSVCCFAGVLLVAAPWKGWQTIQDDAHQRGTPHWHQAVGLAAALGFSVSIAGSSLVLNTKLRGERTVVVTVGRRSSNPRTDACCADRPSSPPIVAAVGVRDRGSDRVALVLRVRAVDPLQAWDPGAGGLALYCCSARTVILS